MNLQSQLFNIILTIPAILVAFVAQGYAKAYMADRLGDKTPRFQGRLTMNPAAHIDPLGFLMIALVGFGWTKPVETNPSAYKRGYKDSLKVSIAPLLGNLIVGFIATIVFYTVVKFASGLPANVYYVLVRMIQNIAVINISLMVFNLLPLPGLAGFYVFRDLSPKNFYKFSDVIYQYQMFILIGVILINRFIPILSIPTSMIISLFERIALFILNIF